MARCSQLLGSKNNSATFRATAKSYASLAAEQGFPAIVFIDAPAALSPIVELAGPYTQPVDESPGADLGFFPTSIGRNLPPGPAHRAAEELLEHRWLQSMFLAQIGNRHFIQQVPP
jgi:hypothetical protein